MFSFENDDTHFKPQVIKSKFKKRILSSSSPSLGELMTSSPSRSSSPELTRVRIKKACKQYGLRKNAYCNVRSNLSNRCSSDFSNSRSLLSLRSSNPYLSKLQREKNPSMQMQHQDFYDNAKQDFKVKNLLIHKNQALLRKIIHRWHVYTLKAFKTRVIKKEKQKQTGNAAPTVVKQP